MAVAAGRKLVMALWVVCAVVAVSLMPGGAEALDTSLVSGLCNTQKIPDGNPLCAQVDAALLDLEQNTAYSGYFYRTQYPSQHGTSDTAYAQGICNQKLSQSECSACLKVLHADIWGICGNAVGARVQFADCFIRYETYNFY